MSRNRDKSGMNGNSGKSGSSWFRAGIITATAVAPLIARWNDLRASNQAQSLREMAAARLSDARDARDLAAIRLAPVRSAAGARLSDAMTVANAKLGDARELANARLGDARVLANSRLDDALERLAQVNTPDALRNVPPFSLATKRAQELAQQRQRQRRQRTFFWLAGVAIGLVAAGATAFVIARRRMALPIEDEEPMVELPVERNLAEATVGQSTATRNSHASPATAATERAEISVPVETMVNPDTVGQAGYIGNIRTMIFHDAEDVSHLPAEENRIYFLSEAEARRAGYRLAREPETFANSDEA